MHPAPDVIFRVLDEGAVLVHLNASRIFELNATGAHVWAMLTRGETIPAVVASLTDTFDVDEATATGQLVELLDRLRAEGLLLP
jgi:hypothetical protein